MNKTYTKKKEEASKVGKRLRAIGKTLPRTLETNTVGKLTHQIKAGLTDEESWWPPTRL